MSNPTRRDFTKMALAASGAVVLAALPGCSSAGSGTSSASSVASSSATAETKAEAPIASLFFISDIHMGAEANRQERFEHALADMAALEVRPDKIVAVGDIANNALEAEYDAVLACIEASEFSLKDDFMMTFGNHDMYDEADDYTEAMFKQHTQMFLSKFGLQRPYYDITVKNQHLIGLGPDVYGDKWSYFETSFEQLAWLDGLLAADAAAGVNSFVLVHEPIPGTVYGAMEGNWGYTASLDNPDPLQDVLEKYPKAVVVSGHTHVYPGITPTDGAAPTYINDGSSGACFLTPEYPRDHVYSIGVQVNVFDDRMEYRVRDFETNSWRDEAVTFHK